jgi:phosphoribosylaminoimidazole-succinocarboxamide synthase
MSSALIHTELPLANRRQGKVRDIYDVTLENGTEALAIIASDRISAFDVILQNGVPGKGIVLTKLSEFWFNLIQKKLGSQLQHHLISLDPNIIPGLSDAEYASLRGRTMIGLKCKVIPIECVVRGYLAGSGWSEYQKSQTVCAIPLPAGLQQCQKLPEPIFTPSTKAETGHDENISFQSASELVGTELMVTLRELSLALYTMAANYAATKGIIIADTKFEFGLPVDGSGTPILIDEVLTPDSSRFWPMDKYQAGRDQESFDKQYVRNYLETLVQNKEWDKTPPGPALPNEVIQGTFTKYVEVYEKLTGEVPKWS